MDTCRTKRLFRIIEVLRSEQDNTADALLENLNISRRTFCRDMQILKELGVSYHFNKRTSSYHLKKDNALPQTYLNDQEAMGLLLLLGNTEELHLLPFSRHLQFAATKLRNRLSKNIRSLSNRIWKRISICKSCIPVTDNFDMLFSVIQNAVIQKFEIEIIPTGCNTTDTNVIRLKPYHLMQHDNQWYVFGKDCLDNTIKPVPFAMMKSAIMLHSQFSNNNLDISEYLGNAWAIKPEGKIYDVKLRFDSQIAEKVISIQWHRTQEVIRNEDGTVTVNFKVDGLEEITHWILSFGDQVEVFGPQILRTRMQQIALKMAKSYAMPTMTRIPIKAIEQSTSEETTLKTAR